MTRVVLAVLVIALSLPTVALADNGKHKKASADRARVFIAAHGSHFRIAI